jgi:hypothetical protein
LIEIQVADKMGKHVDPVAHAAKKVADKAKPAAHPAAATKVNEPLVPKHQDYS